MFFICLVDWFEFKGRLKIIEFRSFLLGELRRMLYISYFISIIFGNVISINVIVFNGVLEVISERVYCLEI